MHLIPKVLLSLATALHLCNAPVHQFQPHAENGPNISIDNNSGNLVLNGGAAVGATYLTESDESTSIPSSYQLLAGENITLTPASGTPNTLTVAATGGGGGGLQFGGSGAQGALDVTGVTTNTPGQQQNWTTLTVEEVGTLNVVSGQGIHATGAVAINGQINVAQNYSGPGAGNPGFQYFDGTNTYILGGGGGGNGGFGGTSGHGYNAAQGGSPLSYNQFFGGGPGGNVAPDQTLTGLIGCGGGVLIIDAIGDVNVGGEAASGSISAQGQNGLDASDSESEYGIPSATGGGAGGTIGIYSQTSIEVQEGSVIAIGGSGGDGNIPGGLYAGGGGGGGQVVLVAPIITDLDPSNDVQVQKGFAGTGYGTTGNGQNGLVFEITATPTLPLAQLTFPGMKLYSKIANAKQEQHYFKISGREWISFLAATQAHSNKEFVQICNELSNNHQIAEPIAVGDLVDSNAS
jgi:hypothetical protein